MSAKQSLTVALLLAAAAACKPEAAPQPEAAPAEDTSPPAQEALPPEVTAQLDSGTAAFRADDYAGALTHYTRATELAPDLAAAWFGVAMAQEALGNAQGAQEALAKTQALEPGTDLAHPTSPDTVR